MATHSSILAWKIPWKEEIGGLQSMVSQRIRHDLLTEHAYIQLFCGKRCAYFDIEMIKLSFHKFLCVLCYKDSFKRSINRHFLFTENSSSLPLPALSTDKIKISEIHRELTVFSVLPMEWSEV